MDVISNPEWLFIKRNCHKQIWKLELNIKKKIIHAWIQQNAGLIQESGRDDGEKWISQYLGQYASSPSKFH